MQLGEGNDSTLLLSAGLEVPTLLLDLNLIRRSVV
jgi:hypothetical protein